MALQPICRWNVVPHADVTGNYFVGAAAFHKDGIVNCGFRLGTSGPPVTVSSMTLNSRTGSWEYCLPIPSALIPSGSYVLQGFAIATTGSQQILPNVSLNIWQTTATYTTFYVDADLGSDAAAGSIGAPFLTLKKGLEALAGVGDGGRIYLKAATAEYNLNASPSVVPVTTLRYVNIEAAPGALKSAVVIGSWTASSGVGATKVRIARLTIKDRIRAATVDAATLWLDDCLLLGPGQIATFSAQGWASGWAAKYFTSGEVTDARQGLNGWDLVSGATFQRIGEKMLHNCPAVYDISADNIDRLTDATLTPAVLSYDTLSNVLVSSVRAFDNKSQGLDIINPTGVTGTTANAAFVNVLFEGPVAGTFTSQVKDHQVDHLLIVNCNFVNKPFVFRTNSLANMLVLQTVFESLQTAPGDILGQRVLNPAQFSNCHYVNSTLFPGVGATQGTPGYTSAGTNDYTPTAGSILWLGHSVPHLVPNDAEQVARDNPTTVGPLKGAAESSGAGSAPPSALTYSPAITSGTTGSAITPITPSYQGVITKFELAPSVYHIYQAPAEIACDSANAHFEVRAWTAGDGTDPGIAGGHYAAVVVDLRNGHVYLRNPKDSTGFMSGFGALAFAMNISGPFASEGGAVANGPWPAERPIVRYRGQALQGTLVDTNDSCHIGRQPNKSAYPNRQIVAWAGEAGWGGFYPFYTTKSVPSTVSEFSAPLGKGAQITLSVVGATGGKADRISGPWTFGYGFVNAGVADPTYAPIDVLFKDLTLMNNFTGAGEGNHAGCFQTPDKKGRTGRLRLYDYGFMSANPTLFYGWGVKQWVEFDAGAHFDFRRGVYPASNEHANYIQGPNAGLLRDATVATGGTPDSWFIDLTLPEGTARTLLQFVDRPWDLIETGPTASPITPQPSHKCRPAGKGLILIERCQVLKGSTDNPSYINMPCGPDLTFVLRGNLIKQTGAIGGTQIFKATGASVPTTTHKRGVLVYGENGGSGPTWVVNPGSQIPGIRLNENGFNTRRVVIIDHTDICDNPSEKRMTFRGVEEVHVYSFTCTMPLGGTGKPTIELDGADFSPFAPVYTQGAPHQFNLNGNLVYAQSFPPLQTGFGAPLSTGGPNYPHSGRMYLYMGYPALPAGYSGWLASKLVGCIWPDLITKEKPFTAAEINALAGVPVYLPTGLTLSPTTGIVSGTPTQAIGKDPGSGTALGLEITSPLTYAATGHARIPIKGSNASSADAWTGGTFQLGIIDLGAGGTQFILPPVVRVGVRSIPPPQVQVDANIRLNVIRVGVRSIPPEFITDNGAITQVFAPVVRVAVRSIPPDLGTDQNIEIPVIRVAVSILGIIVIGGIEKGDFAGQVLTSGCEIGEVLV